MNPTLSITRRAFTSRQMFKADPLPAGFIWRNEAPLGRKPRWVMRHEHNVVCHTCGALNASTSPVRFVGGCWMCGRPSREVSHG